MPKKRFEIPNKLKPFLDADIVVESNAAMTIFRGMFEVVEEMVEPEDPIEAIWAKDIAYAIAEIEKRKKLKAEAEEYFYTLVMFDALVERSGAAGDDNSNKAARVEARQLVNAWRDPSTRDKVEAELRKRTITQGQLKVRAYIRGRSEFDSIESSLQKVYQREVALLREIEARRIRNHERSNLLEAKALPKPNTSGTQ